MVIIGAKKARNVYGAYSNVLTPNAPVKNKPHNPHGTKGEVTVALSSHTLEHTDGKIPFSL